MATKKKLVDMDVKHMEWVKKAAKELGRFEKDIIFYIFESAIKNNVLDTFKQKVVTSDLQRTLEQLSKGAAEVAKLQERSKELLEQMERTEGKEKE